MLLIVIKFSRDILIALTYYYYIYYVGCTKGCVKVIVMLGYSSKHLKIDVNFKIKIGGIINNY